jgi:hypothetical protein
MQALFYATCGPGPLESAAGWFARDGRPGDADAYREAREEWKAWDAEHGRLWRLRNNVLGGTDLLELACEVTGEEVVS